LPLGAQSIRVPFSKQEVEGWRDFLVNRDRSFTACVSALKVTYPCLVTVTMMGGCECHSVAAGKV
jgi:hypothetical protein